MNSNLKALLAASTLLLLGLTAIPIASAHAPVYSCVTSFGPCTCYSHDAQNANGEWETHYCYDVLGQPCKTVVRATPISAPDVPQPDVGSNCVVPQILD